MEAQAIADAKAFAGANMQDLAADQKREWNIIKTQIDPFINPRMYVHLCVERLTQSAQSFGMRLEDASQGVAERCEKLVSDFRECAVLTPNRPKRCKEQRAHGVESFPESENYRADR